MIVLEYQKKTNRIFSELECHCHSVYEIYYFISGDANIMVEGKIHKLTPHSLLLIAPQMLHGIQVTSDADYVRTVLFLTPKDDLIPERTHLLTSIMPDHKKNANQEFFYEHTESFRLDEFFYNLKQLEDQPADVRELLEPVFTEALISQIHLLCRTMKPSSLKEKAPEKIMDIINYINLHLTEDLSLESVAKHFFISQNYLNKNFKQYLGTTVAEYIRFKRVAMARQYIYEGESATSAALRAGFADYSSFYRSYKKYVNSSPRKDLSKS